MVVVRAALAEGRELVMATFPRWHVPESAASSQPGHKGIPGKPRETGFLQFLA